MTRLLLFLLATALAAQPRLEVIAAYYGLDTRFAEVTERVRGAQLRGVVQLTVGGDSMGIDPLPGTVKVLRVYYRVNGVFAHGEWRDGELVRIPENAPAPAPTVSSSLRLLEARYGSTARSQDVLARLQSLVQNNRLNLTVSNQTMGGDPAVGAAKSLVLTYEWQGQRFEVRTREGRTLNIPGEGAAIGGHATSAPAQSTDNVCFFAEPNYQGAQQCWRAGEEQPQFNAGTRFASVRFTGNVRAVELFEAVRFNGRVWRVEGNQPDLAAAAGGGGGGFFSNTNSANAWALTPGSLRVVQ